MFAPSVLVRTSPVSPSCCQQVWGRVSPRGGDQPESMEVQRSWLFGLRRTLTSTHPRVAGRAAGGWGMEEWRGWGSPLSRGPSPDLGPVARAEGHLLLCQLARMARRPWGQSALAQALWCQLGLGRPGAGEEGSGESRGPTPAPLPASCSRAGVEGPSEEGGDSLGLALQLLRSETVKVYVNNEINILVSFFF